MGGAELRVLVVEATAEGAAVLLQHLTELSSECALTVDQASSEAETRSILDANEHDLVFLGFLQGVNTLSFLREEAQRDGGPPIVLLVEETDAELVKMAAEAGATDLLVKSRIRRSALAAAVRNANHLREVR